MKTRTNIITLIAFMCLAVFVFQGCDTLKEKMPGASKETEEPEDQKSTGEAGETGDTTAAVEEESWVKITNFEDGATGIDTKLPVEWWVDPKAGNVKEIYVNIFECDPDGKEKTSACVIFTAYNDENIVKATKWTFFEKEVDKHWVFTDNHNGMKELKPKTKYLMNFVVKTDSGKSNTARVYFTTK